MTVESMSKIMMCMIILHNMCVEGRLKLEMEEEEKIYVKDIIVGGGFTPLCAVLVRLSDREVVSASTCSIFAVCQAWSLMEDKAEHDITKHLLIKQICDRYGDE